MALLTNLVSYWKLDEASGNALDAHGSNHLADNNTVGSATGKISNARDFELSNSEYFSIADNTDLSTGDIDFTITAWVNAESLPNNAMIVSKWGSSDFEHILFYTAEGTNRFRFHVRDSANSSNALVLADNFGAASTGNWYFICAWHDSANNQLGISINAGTPNTASHSGGVRNSTAQFRIGARQEDGLYWDGLIDEVGFWKRVLTSQERTDLYNGGAGLPYSSFGGGGGGVPLPVFVHHYRMQGAA